MVLFMRVSSGPKTPPGVVVFRIMGLADAVPRSAGKPLIGRNSRPPRPPTNHPSGWFGSVGELHSLVRNVLNGVSSTLHGTCRVAALRAFQMRDLSLIRASRGVPPGECRDAPGPDPWGAGPIAPQDFLVSQKISAISSILDSSSSAFAASSAPFTPVAPASLVASLKRVWSCGYFSKCGGLK